LEYAYDAFEEIGLRCWRQLSSGHKQALVTDHQESMAFLARSRSRAVGAKGGVPLFTNNFDLDTLVIDMPIKDHSNHTYIYDFPIQRLGELELKIMESIGERSADLSQ
jgi:hypothetical protein